MSIASGTPPSEHGIVGDYCIDGDLKGSDCLFADSILTELSHDGVSVLFMSVTEEFREQCAYDLHPNSTSLSLESLIDGSTSNNALIDSLLRDNKICEGLDNLKGVIKGRSDESGECGLFLLELMRKIIEDESIETPKLCYISLSPATLAYYYDHRSPQMMHFMAEIDSFLRVFDENGCRFGVTSGHGTNYKLGAKGDLFVVNVAQQMRECFASFECERNFDVFSLFSFEIVLQKACTNKLFGFCHIYIVEKETEKSAKEVKKDLIFYALCFLRKLKGIYSSIGHEEACRSLELPPERIGDIVLLGDVDAVFGDENDVETAWRLSHGSLEESTVPMVLNERPTEAYLAMLGRGKGRNYHLFDVLLNGFDEKLQQHCPYQYSPSQYQYIGK